MPRLYAWTTASSISRTSDVWAEARIAAAHRSNEERVGALVAQLHAVHRGFMQLPVDDAAAACGTPAPMVVAQ